ncbi:MAG: hypothetical protein JWP91_4359 [Fibrobacteres bacterium]|nr:hypothetical protein [Fibrobacterota bacterium]
MARRPDPLRGYRTAARSFLFAALFTASASSPLSASDKGLAPDGTERPPAKLSTMLEAGTTIAIGSDLGAQPQLGAFRDLTETWQMGIQARVAPGIAHSGYDFLPQVNLATRMLWLGDEDKEPIRNSEYFGLSAGGFFAYNFGGGKAGLKPFGTLSLGKYWMPFDNQPMGLDLNLELTRYFSGHLPGRSELVYITTGIHLFYVVP